MTSLAVCVATSIAAAIHTTALFFLIRRPLRGMYGWMLFISASKTIAATGALCLATWLARIALDSALPHYLAVKLHAVFVLAGAGAAGLASYLLVASLLRMQELRGAIDMVLRRGRRS